MGRSKTFLPNKFSCLDDIAREWSLPTMERRWEKRRTAHMDTLADVYNRLLPVMDDMMGYLNAVPLEEMPKDKANLNLLYLAYSFMEISTAIERWNEPELSGAIAFDAARLQCRYYRNDVN